MTTSHDLAEFASSAEEIRPSPPVRLAADSGREITGNDWMRIGTGITLAGGLYPAFLALAGSVIGVVVLLVRVLTEGVNGSEALEGFVLVMLMGFHSATAMVLGIYWTAIVVIVVLPLVYFVAWSLKFRGSVVWLGAFCGGLVGFLAVLPLLLLAGVGFRELRSVAAAVALGPGLTTILGQLGGAWGATQRWGTGVRSDAAVVERSSRAEFQLDMADQADRAEEGAHARFQFGIRHLLWIAVWLSLLLSVIRLLGIPFEFILPLLGGWLVYQAATLWIGRQLARRLEPWWRSRRMSRST